MDSEWKSTAPFYMEGSGTNKRICLLLIHGFTGNPRDFRRMAKYLNDAGYTVQAIRLPGHGTGAEPREDRTDMGTERAGLVDSGAWPHAYQDLSDQPTMV